MSGCASIASVISRENTSRSTVSACPPGTRAGVGRPQQQRAEPPHLLLQQPGRGVHLFALERIAANQFAQGIGLMRRGALSGTHFVQHDPRARFRRLKRRFAAGETGANNVDRFQDSILGGGLRGRRRSRTCPTSVWIQAALPGSLR